MNSRAGRAARACGSLLAAKFFQEIRELAEIGALNRAGPQGQANGRARIRRDYHQRYFQQFTLGVRAVGLILRTAE